MLRLNNIYKKLGEFELKNINFTLEEGDYFVLLGKSGAGKSIILELISGLSFPDKGEIFIQEKDVTRKKIQKRKIGLVFQSHSLFPHMSVMQNILYSYGKLEKKYKTEKARLIANILGIEHLLNRYPGSLSLGESQRVALARTIITEPSCLMLDEPLASLDPQTKEEIRSLLRKINRGEIVLSEKTGRRYTPKYIIHVTHDYEEAIALANKIGVIEGGKISQIGTPNEIFREPKSSFVAKFVGIKNFFSGKLERVNKNCASFYIDRQSESDETKVFQVNTPEKVGKGFVMLRSEDVTISNSNLESSARNNFQGVVTDIEFVVRGVQVTVDIGIIKISSLITNNSLKDLNIYSNKMVFVSFKASSVKFIKIKQ